MRKRLLTGTLGALLALGGVARAQDAAAEDPNTGALSVAGGIDATTHYFFRGYLQEDQGLILQPYGTLYVNVHESDNLKITPYVGIWNSWHDEKTGADGTHNESWYESDIFGGVDVAMGDFTLGLIYTHYTYPNGALEDIGEIGFKLSWNDAAFTKDRAGLPFQLSPYIAAYFEPADDSGSEDSYLELGIAPSFAVGDAGWTLGVPVVLGMSLEDYYFDDDGDEEFLGYASIGVTLTIPLSVPARYGSWNLIGGVSYLQLLAESLETINNDDDNEIIGKLGIAFSY
jgi:hypothetical protein